MQLIYCDESNLEEQPGHFFVYGGVSVDSSKILSLHKKIEDLRKEMGVDPEFVLKFNPGPENLNHEKFIELKQGIIEAAIEHDCVLFASLILHDIATSPIDARLNEINRICFHFNCYLNRADSPGLVIIDRFSGKEIDHHLRDKFLVGLRNMPYTSEKRLKNIMGLHYSTVGQSHMCSVVDVIIGSLRLAINSHMSPSAKTKETAKTLVSLIGPMFFREAGSKSVSEIGLFFSPKIIKAAKYRTVYENLHAFFQECGVTPEQGITGERTY